MIVGFLINRLILWLNEAGWKENWIFLENKIKGKGVSDFVRKRGPVVRRLN